MAGKNSLCDGSKRCFNVCAQGVHEKAGEIPNKIK